MNAAKAIVEPIPAEELFEMATLGPRTTGVNARLWVSQEMGKRHKPRLKIQMEHGSEMVPVSILEPVLQLAGAPLPAPVLKDVSQFIQLNRDALLAYWNGDIFDTKEFIDQLKPI